MKGEPICCEVMVFPESDHILTCLIRLSFSFLRTIHYPSQNKALYGGCFSLRLHTVLPSNNSFLSDTLQPSLMNNLIGHSSEVENKDHYGNFTTFGCWFEQNVAENAGGVGFIDLVSLARRIHTTDSSSFLPVHIMTGDPSICPSGWEFLKQFCTFWGDILLQHARLQCHCTRILYFSLLSLPSSSLLLPYSVVFMLSTITPEC